MSNEQQFDDRVKRMFQGESVAAPSHLEERVFAQLAPAPWSKRLGLTGGVLLICAVGWWSALDDSSESMELTPKQTSAEISVVEPAPIREDVVDFGETNGSVEFQSDGVSSAGQAKQGDSAEVHPNGLMKEEGTTDASSLQSETFLLELLDRVPAVSIDLDSSSPSNLKQATEEQWVMPAVVKVKN